MEEAEILGEWINNRSTLNETVKRIWHRPNGVSTPNLNDPSIRYSGLRAFNVKAGAPGRLERNDRLRPGGCIRWVGR
jgi:hypothetical protein